MAAFGLGLAAVIALAQGLPTVTVTRGERTIVVAQLAAAAEGARTVLANRNCEAGVLSNVFFGPVPGYVETRIDDTVLVSQVALVRVPAGGAAEDEDADESEDAAEATVESSDDETIELYGGRVTFDRPGCVAEVDDADALPVELRQGRTTVFGTRFFLDRGTDIATMDGPIALTRAAAEGDDRPPLEARSAELTFDVDSERATLIGDVEVTSGERVSVADRLELDEDAGVALLTGAPAVSRRGTDEVRGSTLRYDLETDEVIAIGSVFATFEVDLDD